MALKSNVDFKHVHVFFKPPETLRKERMLPSKGQSSRANPILEALQRSMNTVTDLGMAVSSRINSSGDFELNQNIVIRCLSFLALAISRGVVQNVVAECIYFSFSTLSKLDVDISKNPKIFSSFDLTLLQEALESLAELVARCSQVFVEYFGDEHNQKEHMSKCIHIISSLWQRFPFDFSHGVLIARGFHGTFSSIAGRKEFDEVCGPIVELLEDYLSDNLHEQTRNDSRSKVIVAESNDELFDKIQKMSVATYMCSGLLRGGSEYAWATDLNESPQPRLQAAMHEAAKNSSNLLEAMEGEFRHQKFATYSRTEDKLIHLWIRANAVNVGLSIVYADNHVVWNKFVVRAVLESLLSGALYGGLAYGELFDFESNIGILERAAAADRFQSSEVFKLAPQLVSLIVNNLAMPTPLLNVKVVDDVTDAETDEILDENSSTLR